MSGIGFLGAGVIFVNNDAVRGLTTAATIWVSAAIGMACGASLFLLATVVLGVHYISVFAVGPLSTLIPTSGRNQRTVIEYQRDQSVMRRVLETATSLGYTAAVTASSAADSDKERRMRVVMRFEGRASQSDLVSALATLRGVCSVSQIDANDLD